MLDIGFGEIIVILIIGVLVLKPEDIPGMLRTAGKYAGKLQDFWKEITDAVKQTTKDSGLHDVPGMTEIIDLEGKPQKAYDVTKIEELK